jgi:hypothetical protein
MMSINRDINNVTPGIQVLTFKIKIRRVLDEGRADEKIINVNIPQLW